ncbi:MAG: ketopantoate reductase family protein [Rhodospirillaceae bacterium]
MQVCIFGAGAVGGHVAARLLAAKSADVSVIARGAALQAMRSRGLTLRYNGKEEIHAAVPVATDDPSTLPAQDYVVVTLKAPALPGVARTIARLLKPDGCAVFLTNGIPWWWPQGLDGKGPLPLLDPEGELWSKLRTRTLGCVVYSPNEPVEPGVIVHRGANRWIMGEPDNTLSDRLKSIVKLFDAAGLKAEASTNVRREIWLKLVRNASNNTLSALIRRPLAEASGDPELRRIAAGLINETIDVGAALGYDIRADVNVEEMTARAELKGGPRTSMLQDVLQGRAMEVEALLGQTQSYARSRNVPVPTIDVILPLLRALDGSRLA